MDEFDVVVIGGRVAGASTALLLARAGVRVAVVERMSRGSDTTSTHGLMRAGVLQLDRWGLLDDVVAAGTPAIRTTVFHYADVEPVRVTIRPAAGVDALYAPRRQLLDALILDAAEQAGAVVFSGMTATGLMRDDAGRVTGTVLDGRDGTTARLRSALTVGADGFASFVAREVAAPVVRRGRFGSAVLYAYVGMDAEGYEWAYGQAAATGLIPTNDGEVCVFVGTTPADMHALRRDGAASAFAALLRRASPALFARVPAEAAGLARIRGWRGAPGFIRRAFGPGWALVGDAGCFRDPISTHGMSDAMRDAELLASAVIEALSGRVPESVALGSYQVLRDRLSRRLFDIADRIAAYDWTDDEIRTLLRALSSSMSDEVDLLCSLPRSEYAHLDRAPASHYRVHRG